MSGLSEKFRLPVACPSCGSHRMGVSQVKNPDDKAFCTSCSRFVCLYHEAGTVLQQGSGSEALIVQAANRGDC